VDESRIDPLVLGGLHSVVGTARRRGCVNPAGD